MKGLIINSMGRTEEAFAIAKDALRQDMRSHVCWHVYGLLYRAEKNFEESVKAYKMALRFEPDSPQILRDLALLQIQMRDYNGYIETRTTQVQQRPNIRANWTALAIAHHLAGHYAQAEQVLTKYETTMQGKPMKWDIEHWEACLYKNKIIAESGDTERALEHLETIAKRALDKTAVLESRGSYQLALGKLAEAEKTYRTLLGRNQENRSYYAGLEKALGIQPDARDAAKAIYEEYAEKYARADAPRRIPLDFLTGEDFKTAADTYLQRKLRKGVPSTFANIKALYTDVFKRETIFNHVYSYHQEHEKLDDEVATNGDVDLKEAARFRIWTLYFLAQHYDHFSTRDFSKALHFLNKAINLEPETVELHMTFARVHKHAGDLQTAMERMDEARNLDKSDRYINTKTAKYQLRNGDNAAALATMSLFTRNDPHGGPLGDLLEMQCMWFITEDAESHARQHIPGIALKRYNALYKIFDDWAEDQFDFHSFSLRKGMIRAYVDMLRWEDTLRSHPFFIRAALGAIAIYTQLHDNPEAASQGMGANYPHLSEDAQKKAVKKQRKAETAAAAAAAEVAQKQKEERNKNAQASEEPAKKEDTDPIGLALVKTKTPLKDAMKWVNQILKMAPENFDVQIAAFSVFVRDGKFEDALKALQKAKELKPEHPKVHEALVRLRHSGITPPPPSPIDIPADIVP